MLFFAYSKKQILDFSVSYRYNTNQKECDKMQDLEESSKLINSLNLKLKDLGDSL